MKFRFNEQQETFRTNVREFLSEQQWSRGEEGWSPAFSKKLSAKGWIGLPWPVEYGGQGLGAIEQLIYSEEMILHEAPRGYHMVAERQVAPSIIRHGTEEQRKTWLSRIVNADVSFCLGLSEPGAGSDLAAVTTRAVRDGDEYVVNGQKIWTSGAHRSDAIWLVVRTNPDVPKHKGISCLMVDMDSPGITVRPLGDMTGRHHFNEVFFEDVRVPVDRRVGEEDRGWYVLAEHLDFERSGIERLIEFERLFRRVLDFARSQGDALDHSVRMRLADLETELQVGRLLCYRSAWLQSVGAVPNYEASMSKLFGSEWCQHFAGGAMDVLSMLGGAYPADATLAATIQSTYLSAVSRTIAGGTSEIQRNIIATRGLGLPRS